MEGKVNVECVHLFKKQSCRKLSEVYIEWEANYQLMVPSGKEKNNYFEDALKYKNQLSYTSDISYRIFCLLFITSAHKKYLEIKECVKKSKNAKRVHKCGILESCGENWVDLSVLHLLWNFVTNRIAIHCCPCKRNNKITAQ